MECGVCCGRDKRIRCGFCNFECCVKCVKKYVLESNDFFKCMECREYWSTLAISSKLSNKFMNTEYKVHLENVLFDRQLVYMNKTRRIMENNRKLEFYKNNPNEENRTKYLLLLEENGKNKFYGFCPNKCDGYIDSENFCDKCEIEVCGVCKEVNSINHKCNLNNVKSVCIIDKNYKKCPSCNINIEKVDGCNEMVCAKCDVKFNWRTLELYGNENPQDPVSEIAYFYQNFYSLEKYLKTLTTQYEWVFGLNKFIYYLKYGETVRLQKTIDDQCQDLKSRISYLSGDLDVGKFKNKLRQIYKKKCKYRDIQQVYGIFINKCIESVSKYLYVGKNQLKQFDLETFNHLEQKVEDILDRTNIILNRLSEVYKNKFSYIKKESNRFILVK